MSFNFRKFCKGCEKLFRPKGDYTKYCDTCRRKIFVAKAKELNRIEKEKYTGDDLR